MIFFAKNINSAKNCKQKFMKRKSVKFRKKPDR